MNLVAIFFQNVFTVTFYVDNEIFKQIDVELGTTLGGVSAEVGIDSKTVVGFENVNILTSASAFNDFKVIDDVVVYLTEASEELKDDNTPGGIKEKFSQFGDEIKSFFVRVGQFFKAHWKITVGVISGVVVLAIVIAIVVKRR